MTVCSQGPRPLCSLQMRDALVPGERRGRVRKHLESTLQLSGVRCGVEVAHKQRAGGDLVLRQVPDAWARAKPISHKCRQLCRPLRIQD